ncbi:MAG: cupin domain-containing protein [Anaerolineae bacterium]|nr:cupin domain-containing protein [Anaerolineae bacterium]
MPAQDERAYQVLDVPYRSQLDGGAEYGKACGPTSAAMIACAYTGQDVQPGQYYTDLAITGSAMQDIAQLKRWLEDRWGIAVTRRENITLADLESLIAAKKPVLARFDYGAFRQHVTTQVKTWNDGHFGVIVGIDADYVYLHDPLWTRREDNTSNGTAIPIRREVWMDIWNAGENYCLGLVPRDGLDNFVPAKPCRKVTVTSPDGLSIRLKPSLSGQKKAEGVPSGDQRLIWAVRQDADGSEWGAISADLGEWIMLTGYTQTEEEFPVEAPAPFSLGGALAVLPDTKAPAMLVQSKDTVARRNRNGLTSHFLLDKNAVADTPLAVTWVDVPPGSHQNIHHHPETQVYVIVAGSGLMHVGGEEREVQAGDLAYIPSGADHGITNTGDTLLSYVSAATPAIDLVAAYDGGQFTRETEDV